MVLAKLFPHISQHFLLRNVWKNNFLVPFAWIGVYLHVFCYKIAGWLSFVFLRSDSDSAKKEKWHRHSSEASVMVGSMRIKSPSC